MQLVHAVQPLQKDGAALVHVVRLLAVAAAVAELVAEVQPLRLHQHLEALPMGAARTGGGGVKVCDAAYRSNMVCMKYTNSILRSSTPVFL